MRKDKSVETSGGKGVAADVSKASAAIIKQQKEDNRTIPPRNNSNQLTEQSVQKENPSTKNPCFRGR